MVVLRELEKPPFFTFFNFTLSPDLCSFLGLNLFDGGRGGYVHTAVPQALLQARGSDSVVPNGDVGRTGLVIFQAWSVFGR